MWYPLRGVDNWAIPESLAVALLISITAMLLLATVNRVPIGYNVMNMVVRWKNTLMTALAFTLVIGLLTVMQAFVNGMYELTESSGRPGNVMILSEGSTDETFSNLDVAGVAEIESQPGILRRGDQPVASRETFLVATQPIDNAAPGRPKRRFLQIRGIVDAAMASEVHGMTLHPGGGWFSEAGVRPLPGADENDAPAIEVVLGEGAALEMARNRTPAERAAARVPDRLDTGDTFSLADRTWVVVGVMQFTGSTFDSEVWTKQSLTGPMFGKPNYTTLVVKTADDHAARVLKEYLNNEYKKTAISAQLEGDYYKGLSQTNVQFLVAIRVVAGIMAIGGIFGVMNTMFAAISQRTRDIGVMRLMGFRRRHILVSFLLESLLLAAFGGVIGCLVGSFADGITANSVVSGAQGGGKSVVLELSVTGATLAGGMILGMAMGLLGGLIPSISAVRLRSLDALR